MAHPRAGPSPDKFGLEPGVHSKCPLFFLGGGPFILVFGKHCTLDARSEFCKPALRKKKGEKKQFQYITHRPIGKDQHHKTLQQESRQKKAFVGPKGPKLGSPP